MKMIKKKEITNSQLRQLIGISLCKFHSTILFIILSDYGNTSPYLRGRLSSFFHPFVTGKESQTKRFNYILRSGKICAFGLKLRSPCPRICPLSFMTSLISMERTDHLHKNN